MEDQDPSAAADLNGLLSTLGAKDVDEALKQIDQLRTNTQESRQVLRKLDMLQTAVGQFVRPANWATPPTTPGPLLLKKKETDGPLSMFLLLALTVPLTLETGWVIWSLWAWFLVPLGVPALGFWQASGLLLLKDIIVARRSSNRPANDILSETLGWMVMLPVIWGLGRIFCTLMLR
jgi:hypothetical protein